MKLRLSPQTLLVIDAFLDQAEEWKYGYDLSREIARRSGGVLTFRATSLYPALYRLEDRGLIVGRWRRIDERRRRCYRLTAEGRAALARQRTRWSVFVRALRRAAGLHHA